MNAECPVMVVAMAAWCRPAGGAAHLVSLYQQYSPQGLNMIGLSLDATGPAAMHLSWTRWSSLSVYWGGDKMAFQYRINAIPLNMIDNRGRSRKRSSAKDRRPSWNRRSTTFCPCANPDGFVKKFLCCVALRPATYRKYARGWDALPVELFTLPFEKVLIWLLRVRQS